MFFLEVAKPGAKGLVANRTGEEASRTTSCRGREGVVGCEECRNGAAGCATVRLHQPKNSRQHRAAKGFDFSLEWARDISGESMFDNVRETLGMSGPSLETALKELLGLRLKPGKGPVETFVIESAQPATPN